MAQNCDLYSTNSILQTHYIFLLMTTIKQIIIIWVLLLGITGSLGAQAWIEKIFDFEVYRDVTYGTSVDFNGNPVELTMDIFVPRCEVPAANPRSPLLIWIHGGAFLAGNKEDASIQAFCEDFAKRGYVTASINYRKGFIADEALWQCNYPNYNCVFATDSAEWARAYYRAVQDGKGALRFLINRNDTYHIDVQNVFVAGESAGAFTALGVGLMDHASERPPQTFQASNVPIPNANNLACLYNNGQIFDGNSVARPDLGHFNGQIEPTTVDYTIKGIGNMYGAMLTDLLREHPSNKPKPAIYSFHQPCDIVVPIDSNRVYWGLTWCLTNGYNCFGIRNNNIMLYGSRIIQQWNTQNDYEYPMQAEFTSLNFPYSFLFGTGSCLDQVSNPCHAYDNRGLREQHLAAYFAEYITTAPLCTSPTIEITPATDHIQVYINPTHDYIAVISTTKVPIRQTIIYDMSGRMLRQETWDQHQINLELVNLAVGTYILHVVDANGARHVERIVKR
jgi:acetyl esterase/lipase